MNIFDTTHTILYRWRLFLTCAVIFSLLAFIISVLLPAKYESHVSLIVVQKQEDADVDAYSATKSAEFLSNILSKTVYTTSFFNAVQNAPFEVKKDFSPDPQEREKQWEQFIDVKKVNNTGIMHVRVYDRSRTKAEESAKAIAYVLTTNADVYHGGGESVEVRLIDGPNTPLRPTVPHIAQNTLIGFVCGIAVAMVIVYFFPHNLILVPHTQHARRKNAHKKPEIADETEVIARVTTQEKIAEELPQDNEVEEVENTEDAAVAEHFAHVPQNLPVQENMEPVADYTEEEPAEEHTEETVTTPDDPEVRELLERIRRFHEK